MNLKILVLKSNRRKHKIRLVQSEIKWAFPNSRASRIMCFVGTRIKCVDFMHVLKDCSGEKRIGPCVWASFTSNLHVCGP